ncbi:MAG: hypothetical protein HKN30_06475 [Sulfitobacter sp.]|nr:hypothetical protein [Sulfitobacter sp.]
MGSAFFGSSAVDVPVFALAAGLAGGVGLAGSDLVDVVFSFAVAAACAPAEDFSVPALGASAALSDGGSVAPELDLEVAAEADLAAGGVFSDPAGVEVALSVLLAAAASDFTVSGVTFVAGDADVLPEAGFFAFATLFPFSDSGVC